MTFSQFCTALVGSEYAPFEYDVRRGFTDGVGDFSCDGMFIILGDAVIETADQAKAALNELAEGEERPVRLRLIVVQAKMEPYPKHGDVFKFAGDVQRVLCNAERDLVTARMHQALLERARACRALMNGTAGAIEPSVHLVFAVSGEVRPEQNVDAEQARRQQEENLRKILECPVRYEFWGVDELLHAYESSRLGTRKRLEEVALIPMPPSGSEGYIGYVSAGALARFIQFKGGGGRLREDNLLFYENVRHHLGDIEHNVGAAALKTTLAGDERSHVLVRNNGVTIVARSAKQNGDSIELVGAQIVNGAQTSITLLRNPTRLDSVHVPLKVVVTSDEKTKAGVIRGANTQAAVNEYDMLAIEPTVRKLAMDFDGDLARRQDKVWLRRRRSEWVGMPAEMDAWHRVVTPRDLMEAFAAVFLDLPHQVHEDARSLLEFVPNRIFHASHQPQAYRYLAWIIARGREWGDAHKQRWKGGEGVGAYPARHQFAFAFHLLIDKAGAFPRAPEGGYDLQRVGAHAMGYGDLCKRLADREGRDLASQAGKLVEKAAAALKRKLSRDTVRTKLFTEAVRAQVYS